jgi:hypothetical protein
VAGEGDPSRRRDGLGGGDAAKPGEDRRHRGPPARRRGRYPVFDAATGPN